MPITNLLLILFLLGMIYWWAMQGFFSALLHLGLVIAAGALALAFWEPLAHLLLGAGAFATYHAWGLSLLGLFCLILLVLRVLSDKFVPANVQIANMFNMIGGGACGLGSGVLTAGLTIIGIGFLPLPMDIGGYQSHAPAAGGEVEPADSLWVPVDRMAAGFYTSLSQGAFHTSTPLAEYMPDLQRQAGRFRLKPDENASSTASPQSVQMGEAYQHATPVNGVAPAVRDYFGDRFMNESNQLVIIDTIWRKEAGTIDDDGTLRVPPTQIELLTRPQGKPTAPLQSHAPDAFAREENPKDEIRRLYPVEAFQDYASATSEDQRIAWVFLIPEDQQPLRLNVRWLHFELADEMDHSEQQIAAILGGEVHQSQQGDDQQAQAPSGDDRRPVQGTMPTGFSLTNDLPGDISKNAATGFNYTGTSIRSGSATVKSGIQSSLSEATRVESIYEPSQFRTLRVAMDYEQAQSLYGRARGAVGRLTSIVWVEDDFGNQKYPIAYVLQSGQSQRITVSLNDPMDDLRELPIRDMRRGDRLFLYFHLDPGRRITRYHIGGSDPHEVDIPVPAR